MLFWLWLMLDAIFHEQDTVSQGQPRIRIRKCLSHLFPESRPSAGGLGIVTRYLDRSGKSGGRYVCELSLILPDSSAL
jgi:hypothetical protein